MPSTTIISNVWRFIYINVNIYLLIFLIPCTWYVHTSKGNKVYLLFLLLMQQWRSRNDKLICLHVMSEQRSILNGNLFKFYMDTWLINLAARTAILSRHKWKDVLLDTIPKLVMPEIRNKTELRVNNCESLERSEYLII